MSWSDWGEEPFDKDIDEVINITEKSVWFKIDGEDMSIGKSAILNLEEIEQDQENVQNSKVTHVTVPAWLAVTNGWADKDDFR